MRDGDGGADGDAPINVEATRAAKRRAAPLHETQDGQEGHREQAAYDSAASREPADRGASEPNES